MTARSSAYMGSTLTATRANQQPIVCHTLMATSRESPERWRLAHNDRSELNPWIPSQSIAYSGSYRDSYPSGSLLKDEAHLQ